MSKATKILIVEDEYITAKTIATTTVEICGDFIL